jgi:hypothetical protein
LRNYAKQLIWRIFFRKKQTADLKRVEDENKRGNPYLFQIRELMEQILEQRNISYGQFLPILVDGNDSDATLLAARLLGRDLNRIIIFTDRPEYFEEYADEMFKEEGLIPEIFLKDETKIQTLDSDEISGNVILDFEGQEESSPFINYGKKIYIPIFKRRWEQTGNLDIEVPIGYNTVIVRSRRTEEKKQYYDKFEQAFYNNE